MAWFETWFDTPYYHILYQDRDFDEAEQFITLIVNHLKIKQGAEIVDLACGKGRHSVYLQKLGYRVLGLDLSQQSISHNKQYKNASLKFAVHDMRNPIYPNVSPKKVDAIFNLFTSFGYFEKEEDDRKVFQSTAEALKVGGYFVLDFLNGKWVENTLIKEERVTKGKLTFSIKKRIEDQHIIKDIYFNDQGEDFHFFEKVKLHTLDDINAYAENFGYERIQIFGDYHLNEFDLEKSPRCINVFKLKTQKN